MRSEKLGVHSLLSPLHSLLAVLSLLLTHSSPYKDLPAMMPFDRFTQKAQQAATRSLELLQKYKHSQIDTEHIFLALVEQPEGAVPQILQAIGASVDVIARKLEAVLEAAPKSNAAPYAGIPTVQVFITPRLNRVMAAATEEAKKTSGRIHQHRAPPARHRQ